MAYGTVATDVVQSSTTGTPTQFQDGSGTQIGTLCRAWVNFNGTSGSTAIRASFNVSSVTRNGTGDYTITFTNALTDANYSCVGSTGANTAGVTVNAPYNGATASTGSIRIGTSTSGAYSDSTQINVAVFR